MTVAPLKTAVVLGGGPAGLYFAYLLKRRRPELNVAVYERGPADATWGFGVVLADGGLRGLADADEQSFNLISQALYTLDKQTFIVNGEAVPIDKARPGGAIQRLRLLQILHQACRGAGVDLNFEVHIDDLASFSDADLVVGADGANSLIRDSFQEEFGVEKRLLGNRFAWFGVDREFDGSFLNFKAVPKGALVGHYYSYGPRSSTFVMECDARTWSALGLDVLDDTGRREKTQSFFADELGGHDLIENNSVWRQFPVVTCRRWFHDRYVLIGDALRTAHFSIGSGTRMALDDAIALADAVLTEPTREAAFARFQTSRAAPMSKLADAAEGSFNWYEDVSLKLERQSATEFALSFLKRTGRITPERLSRDFPKFLQHAARSGLNIDAVLGADPPSLLQSKSSSHA